MHYGKELPVLLLGPGHVIKATVQIIRESLYCKNTNMINRVQSETVSSIAEVPEEERRIIKVGLLSKQRGQPDILTVKL